MDAFEYAMGLISIVVGLAIGDIGTSFHKLIRFRRSIIWDACPLLAAAFTFVLLFTMWFETWSIHRRAEILTYPFLLSLVVELVLLFLMATTVLPDDPDATTDLGAFYDENARSLWTFFLLFQVSFTAHWFYFVMTSSRFTPAMLWGGVPRRFMLLAIACSLVFMPRRRGLHLAACALMLSYWIFNSWRLSITV